MGVIKPTPAATTTRTATISATAASTAATAEGAREQVGRAADGPEEFCAAVTHDYALQPVVVSDQAIQFLQERTNTNKWISYKETKRNNT